MSNLNFASQIAEWVTKVEGATEAVFRESSQRVAEEVTRTRGAGGNMPVDTGYLRASLMASTSAMPTIRANANPVAGREYAYDPGPVNLIINTATIGDTVYLGFVANYAAHVEYGAQGRPPAMFVAQAAQRWPTIVAQVTTELQSRISKAAAG